MQNLVAAHIQSLFPGYFGARFEPLIRTIGGDVRPDLVLINPSATKWAVVEVELGNHNFHAHVLPQMSKLAHCDDGEAFAEKFAQKLSNMITSTQVREVLSTKPAAVLVTHGSSLEHSVALDRLGIECLDLDIFECIEGPNDYILSVSDRRSTLTKLPAHATKRIGFWSTHWEVTGSIDKKILHENQVIVHFDGTVAAWRVAEIGGAQFLIHPSDLSVPAGNIERRVFLDEDTDEIHLIA